MFQNPVKANFILLWQFFEPISFGLSGMAVDFDLLQDQSLVLWGSLVIVIGLIFRIASSIIVTRFVDFNLKEMVFIAVAGTPKATVQGALGPMPLDYALEIADPKAIKYAVAILVTCVLSIILTSPSGAVLIMLLGPRCLHKTRRQESSIQNNAIN